MKKNKKFMEATPVIETKEASCIPGSVGEFIEILKDFPADAKFTLNGSVDINGKTDIGDEFNTNIYKLPDGDCEPVKEPFFNYPEAKPCCDFKNKETEPYMTEEEEEDMLNFVLSDYTYGLGWDDDNFNKYMRSSEADALLKSPVMAPYHKELQYEGKQLTFNQVKTIDEIRQHNIYVAECMAEMHRREIAALLEYNTQCLAHFGVETNKEMCEIVDSDEDGVKITKF